MFGLLKSKNPGTALVKCDNTSVKLNRRERKRQELEQIKYTKKKESLESSVNYIEGILETKEQESKRISDEMLWAQKDLEKIRILIDERQYGTCSDIARENGWRKAANYFDNAEEAFCPHYRHTKREASDYCSRAVYAIEVALRQKLKSYSEIEKETKKLTIQQTKKQQELQYLLNNYQF
ncbi:hypothetical protein CMI41_01970 [Candidatus Pacearchaeota archaeon]|nr:hypothetical protein [Candidatus Pacearchaeota archaeon]|tara:strand:- start:81 stop:620 length:540 start_codon:yes stop_codon:yes gene_type:complete